EWESGERVNDSCLGGQSRLLRLRLRDARCSLSLGESVRVRGNGADYHLAYRTMSGTIELSENSGEAGGLPNANDQPNTACLCLVDRLVVLGRGVAGCGTRADQGGGPNGADQSIAGRSEEHTSELQSRGHLVCRLLL